jgi:hypothetical protein
VVDAVAPDAFPGGPHDAVPMPQLREADPGGVQGPCQEPADPAWRGSAGAGVAAVQAPDQQQARPVPADAEEAGRRPHPPRRRREGAAAAEPAEDAEPGGGAGEGVQGDEGADVQDGQGQDLLQRSRRLVPSDRRQSRLAQAVLMGNGVLRSINEKPFFSGAC